ncbi:carboxymuconolactone decarboxylase family protein [Nocardioides acrostichi]|uniref:Carboxymuconolactone decarboxylase family protein n=1 Tax=Nocardioides acrostichi TaxID=2784339 RepID=A0A930V0P1_9ACTN|nr:carboxymuconolactone decarboxylase family protein [Nocardioides acrostichi]MBF4161565.1 carboxymuconolactone decarboxylase family protein [Nocardioides acrostichi]
MATPAWRDVLRNLDPRGLEAVTAALHSANQTSALSTMEAELVTIAAALVARAPANVTPHVRKALECGATTEHLTETLLLASTIGGMATLVEGLQTYAALGIGSQAPDA